MILGPVIVQVAALTGWVAAAIAVGGFLAHAWEAILGASEQRLRRLTAIGGLGGVIAVLVILLAGALT